MSYWRIVLPSLAAIVYALDANAQLGAPIHGLPNTATSPLPSGSCFVIDQFNSVSSTYQTVKLCNNWATAIGAATGVGGGNPITTNDTFGNSVSSLTTLSFGLGFTVASGVASGLANVSIFAPDRTVNSGSASFVSGDLGGIVNLTTASSGFTVPATGAGVWSQGGMAILNDINIPSVPITNNAQVNGCGTTISSGGFYIYTNNGTSLDCFGFPGASTILNQAGTTLLGTITATGMSALQFYGATNWASTSGTLRLRCQGLVLSGNNFLFVEIGEGGGGGQPAWSTSSNYTVVSDFTGLVTNSTDLLGGVRGGGTVTTPTSIDLELDSVAISGIPKLASWHIGTFNSPSSIIKDVGNSYWNADTAIITGLEVTVSSGLITSGYCSLYREAQ